MTEKGELVVKLFFLSHPFMKEIGERSLILLTEITKEKEHYGANILEYPRFYTNMNLIKSF